MSTRSSDELQADKRKRPGIASLPTALVAGIFQRLDLETHSRLRHTRANYRDASRLASVHAPFIPRRALDRLRSAPSQDARWTEFTTR
jgi:hypothetical protein